MSATLSEATGRPYGIQRVCQAWERSRSALYARQTREQQRHKGEEPARRGPTPTVSDATLLEAIQADLDRSPFQGEGHRKVHARLRILDGIRVARTRVLRVMRAHKLLSPHRGRQGTARVHAGTIVTQAPNVMWGTDGVRVFTLDDGWGWIFTAVEHWNAECVGWHVCKVGSRFAALEPIAQGLRRIYGALDADSARGLALRMDHGSQYLSDHFLNQIRYWGIRPSYGFVEEPETNGVAERWNRTLKEQATHGRIFQNLKEVRAAVTAFVERYNTTSGGYHTPIELPGRHSPSRNLPANSCRVGTSFRGRGGGCWSVDKELTLAGLAPPACGRLRRDRSPSPLSSPCAVWQHHPHIHFPTSPTVRSDVYAHRLCSFGDGVRFWLSQSSSASRRYKTRRPIRVTPGNWPRSVMA